MKQATKNHLSILTLGGITAAIFLHFAHAVRAAPTSLSSLTHLLNGFTTYQARFIQQTYDRSGNLLQSSQGKVYLQRPGKFRWDIKKPSEQSVIASQKMLWIYDKGLSQATQQSINSTHTLNIANLLTKPTETLAQDFSVTAKPCGMSHCYHLTPKSKDQQIRWINLRFDRNKLARVTFQNASLQRHDFHFSHALLNTKLDSRLFNFTPPRGTDVLKN